MSIYKRILLTWASLLPLGILSALMTPAYYSPSMLTNYPVCTLIGIISLVFVALCLVYNYAYDPWLFVLGLRFVLTAEGKFYESRLSIDPEHITRWRDSIDEWVVRKFLKPKIPERRFLLVRRDQPHA